MSRDLDSEYPWRRNDDFGAYRDRIVTDRKLVRDPRPPEPAPDPMTAYVDHREVDRIVSRLFDNP